MDAAIVEQALDLVADGYGVSTAARKLNVPPRTLYDRLVGLDNGRRLSRAKELQADSLADWILRLSRRAVTGKLDPRAAQVAIGAAQWTAARLRPAVYGDRLALTGTDGGPIALSVVDDAELARRVALLLARAAQVALPPARVIDGEHEEIGAPHSEGDG